MRVHPAGLLLVRRGVAPDAVARHLLVLLGLVLVGGIDPSHLGNGEDVLDAALATYSTGDAAVDAENVLVNDGTKGNSVKDLIGLLPNSTTSELWGRGLRC